MKQQRLSRALSIDARESSLMALGASSHSAAAQVHREWVHRHKALEDAHLSNAEVFHSYVKNQTKLSDSCSARLLQDKIALDKLQAEVDTLSSQMKGEQAILDTEHVTLAALKDELKLVEAAHAEDIESCKKAKQVAEAAHAEDIESCKKAKQ